MSRAAMDGIILVDKPRGWSSFDVIRHLRKKLGVRKMGHAGTLDPMATGLLIVGIGPGTKRLAEFLNLPKTYRMAVLLGKRTDTGDLEGRVLEERAVGRVERSRVEETIAGMVGEIELPIPMYSAVKHKGRPLYSYARQGIRVEPKIRKTLIHRLALHGISREPEGAVLDVEMEAGKGTYARAVAEEIGRRLGVPATLAGLRRTRIGPYDVSAAVALKTAP